jgi:branched-chain amino acid transport system ATP-binding protein
MGGGLRIEKLSAQRAGLTVVREVSLRCPPGEVTVLLGANGAGKSTLLDAISGVIPVAAGEVILNDVPIQRLPRDQRAKLGLSYVEQGRTVFGALTVQENLTVVADSPGDIDRAYKLFPELVQRRNIQALSLSGGEQQMLVLARSLVRQPRVLMIDEMSQGLAPVIVKRLLPVVERAAADGIAVLLVEQFANLALQIGSHAYVMTVGSIALDGTCRDLLARPDDMRQAYISGNKARPVAAAPAATL